MFLPCGSLAKRTSLKAFIWRKWCEKHSVSVQSKLEEKEKKLLFSNLQSELLCAETSLNNGAHCPAGFYGSLTSKWKQSQLHRQHLPLADSLIAANTLKTHPEGKGLSLSDSS